MRLFLCLLLAASAVQAGTPANSEAPVKGLPFDQLQAIRRIGQNVIQAQKDAAESSGNKTAADNENLAQLKATVDRLITAESPVISPSASQPVVTNGAAANATPSKTPNQPTGKGLIARMAAQSNALDVAGTLRQDAGQLQGRKNKPANVQEYSGGFPVGEQHGRVYDQWADKLETILSNNAPDRLAQLKAFRDQLAIKTRGDLQPKDTPRTPTIQAGPRIVQNAVNANQSSQ